jgi:hypothetical protein
MIGRIYKVQHLDSNLCYIGSTCNAVRDRWRSHKKVFGQWIKAKDKHSTISLYPYLEQYGIDRFKMLLIKEYEIVDKNQLRVYEQLAINRTKSCCNMRAALQLVNINCMAKHYTQLIAEHKREYHQINKVMFAEKQREYRKVNKVMITEKQREYRKVNSDTLTEYREEYYKANKQSILAKAAIKVICECGTESRKYKLSRHQKSAKHIKLLAALSQ